MKVGPGSTGVQPWLLRDARAIITSAHQRVKDRHGILL